MNSINLETLDLSAVEQGYGSPQAGRSVSGNPLRIAGKQFDTGLGTHADSIFRINLHGNATQFRAHVGVDDEVAGQRASIEFHVLVDGLPAWSSGTMRAGEESKLVEVDLTGKQKLVLKVTDAGDGIDYDHADWAAATITMVSGKPTAIKIPAEKPEFLTPKPGPEPRITGARRFGVRPGNPFLFTITSLGEKPMEFSAEGLPAGLHLNPRTGIIEGAVESRGEWKVQVRAKNRHGVSQRDLTIVCGDEICLTPPMGWNTWQAYGGTVTEQNVRQNAQQLLALGLHDHGFTYINIDDGWQGRRGGPYNAIQPNRKFPNLPGLVQWLHQNGLKAGIYSTPWRGTYEGHIGSSADREDGRYDWQEAGDVNEAERHKNYPDRFHDFTFGKVKFYENDVKQWVDWGFDLLKYDWGPWKPSEVEEMRAILRASGRDMVYSLSNSAPFELAAEWQNRANMWRTTGDMGNSWGTMRNIWKQQSKWTPFARPGHWNDPDMLLLGRMGWNGELAPSKLTPNEMRSHYSLWVLLAAPLLLSCDLPTLDDYTLSLLTNAEVNDVDQDPLGMAGHLWVVNENLEAWVKPLEGGDYAVGLFNLDDDAREVSVGLRDLGLQGSFAVRDLWRQQDLPVVTDALKAQVPRHGVFLARLSPQPADAVGLARACMADWIRRPGMQVQDAYKWLYQAALGGEHAAPSREVALQWLDPEWERLGAPMPGENLIEPLGEGQIVRLNLRPFKQQGGTKEQVLEAFLRSAQQYQADKRLFVAAWEKLGELLAGSVDEGSEVVEWKRLDAEMRAANWPAVHHSETYERQYAPAYRVLTKDFARQIAGR